MIALLYIGGYLPSEILNAGLLSVVEYLQYILALLRYFFRHCSEPARTNLKQLSEIQLSLILLFTPLSLGQNICGKGSGVCQPSCSQDCHRVYSCTDS